MKIYGGDKSNLKSFSVCAALKLCGTDTEGFSCISLSLSPATIATVRIKNDGLYKIINSNSDIMYQCDENKLLDYNDDDIAKHLFRAIALSKGNICGAEILLTHSVDESCFNNSLIAVYTALNIINNKPQPSINEVASLSDNKKYVDNLFACKLYGRKNTVIVKNQKGDVHYLPLNFNTHKLIIARIDSLKESFFKAIKELSQKSTYIQYQNNEQERVLKIIENITTYKAPNKEFSTILKASAQELCSLYAKYGNIIHEACKTAEETSLPCAVFPAPEYNGICAITENSKVDDFITSYTKLYESLAGEKPKFYICNTADSGIELNKIESETI